MNSRVNTQNFNSNDKEFLWYLSVQVPKYLKQIKKFIDLTFYHFQKSTTDNHHEDDSNNTNNRNDLNNINTRNDLNNFNSTEVLNKSHLLNNLKDDNVFHKSTMKRYDIADVMIKPDDLDFLNYPQNLTNNDDIRAIICAADSSRNTENFQVDGYIVLESYYITSGNINFYIKNAVNNRTENINITISSEQSSWFLPQLHEVNYILVDTIDLLNSFLTNPIFEKNSINNLSSQILRRVTKILSLLDTNDKINIDSLGIEFQKIIHPPLAKDFYAYFYMFHAKITVLLLRMQKVDPAISNSSTIDNLLDSDFMNFEIASVESQLKPGVFIYIEADLYKIQEVFEAECTIPWINEVNMALGICSDRLQSIRETIQIFSI